MGAFSHPKQISQELEIYDYTVLRSSWCTIFSQLCLKLARPVRPVSSQPALAASLLGTVIHSPSLYCFVRALVCHILDRVCLGKKWLASSCQFLFSTTYLPLPIKLWKWVKIFKKIKYSNINYVLWNKKALTKGLSVDTGLVFFKQTQYIYLEMGSCFSSQKSQFVDIVVHTCEHLWKKTRLKILAPSFLISGPFDQFWLNCL